MKERDSTVKVKGDLVNFLIRQLWGRITRRAVSFSEYTNGHQYVRYTHKFSHTI